MHPDRALPQRREQVQRLAATDGLTKIANRRTFESTLEREVARATRSAEHLSLVMIDIDHFKRLNDEHGHQAGDEVLRNVAAALSCECRDFDTAARYGGEEFAVVLPGCGPDEARLIAERRFKLSEVALIPGLIIRELGPDELRPFGPEELLFFNINTSDDYARAIDLDANS